MKVGRETMLRRLPAQDRGQKRIDAILEAAAAIVVEHGYEGLTLSEVAERSGSAIGSLYRFFSSKDQLVEALARQISEAIAVREQAVPHVPFADMDTHEFVAWYTGWILETIRQHPAIGGLLHHFGAHCEPLETRAMAPIDAYIAAHAKHLTKAERALVTRMALEVVSGGLTLPLKTGSTVHVAGRQIQLALHGYLREIIEWKRANEPQSLARRGRVVGAASGRRRS